MKLVKVWTNIIRSKHGNGFIAPFDSQGQQWLANPKNALTQTFWRSLKINHKVFKYSSTHMLCYKEVDQHHESIIIPTESTYRHCDMFIIHRSSCEPEILLEVTSLGQPLEN